MTTIAKRVAERIHEDPIIQEALGRGFANKRALAKWLIETSDWDASLSSVVSAVRRHTPEEGEDVLTPAREVLATSHVNSRSPVCSIQLENDTRIEKALPELFDAVDPLQGQTLRVISSDKGFRVIVDEDNHKPVIEILNARLVSRVHQGLTEFSIMIPSEGWETPGILALLCGRLAMRGINIVGVVDGVYQNILLVDDADAWPAYEALAELTGQTPLEAEP